MDWEAGSPHVDTLYTPAMEELFGPVRGKDEPLSDEHRNLATSVQRMAEKVIFHLAEGLYKKTGLKNLCLAGGVAQNSVANGKLVANTSFEKLFVPPAGHDAGTSIGAALDARTGMGSARASIVGATAASASGFPDPKETRASAQPRVIRSVQERRYELWGHE